MKISRYLIFVIILISQLSFKLTAQDLNGKYFPVEGIDKFAGTLRITNPEGMRSDKYNFLLSIPTEIKIRKIK